MKRSSSSNRSKRTIQVHRPIALRDLLGLLGLGLIVIGCTDSSPTAAEDDEPLWDLAECNFDPTYLTDGGIGFDGIPAISDPIMVETEAHEDEFAYLEDDHRVIGIVVDGQPMAIPLSALWHHEIVNLDRSGVSLVVTHASLTGSSRVYQRSAAGGSDFGVSGLLYRNNLVFYDRSDTPSLWAQLPGEGRCCARSGTTLAPYPSVEVIWAGWKALHPNTLVLSTESADSPFWGQYPYGNYETSPDFFFPGSMPPLDSRLPAKERVLAIREGAQGGIAFPFGDFESGGAVEVASGEVNGRGVVAFWRDYLEGAAAFWAEADGVPLTFMEQDGKIVDQETGTTWSFLGVGSGGGLDGVQLEAVAEAAVAYWGAWAAFHPNTEIR